MALPKVGFQTTLTVHDLYRGWRNLFGGNCRALGFAAVIAAAVLLTGCDQISPNLGVAPAMPTEITQVSPNSRTAGCPGFTLYVTGSGFSSIPGMSLQWQKPGSSTVVNELTTIIDDSDLTAVINASDIATQGTALVDVITPGQTPGNGLSNILPFTITAPGGVCSVPGSSALRARNSTTLSSDNFSPAISANSRYVAFAAVAPDPSVNAGTGLTSIFLRDTCVGGPAGCMPQTTLISSGVDGADANGASRSPAISANGRFVAFESDAGNLVPGDTNDATDIFLRDTCNGAPAGCTAATTRMSIGPGGAQANGPSNSPSISANGRFVAFNSMAGNLVVDGSTAPSGAFLRDTCLGAGTGCTPSTTRISISAVTPP